MIIFVIFVMDMEKKHKVVIVGAGISGLSAGVYAARSGFETLIVERLGTPGGVSTCWKRKGYMIEGGVHWLTGSGPDRPLYHVWKQTGALKENNPVYNKDPFFVFSSSDGGQLPLWRDPDKMEATLLEAAPEDRRAIRRLLRHIRAFKNFHSPVGYIPGLKCAVRKPFSLMEFLRMTPALLLAPILWATSVYRYTGHFRNPAVRALLRGIMNPRHNALSYIVTLSSFCYGDSGYPAGGSLLMARNMEDTFLEEGGSIRYGCTVTKVSRHGVQTSDGFIPADAVMVTVDARTAIDMLFGRPLSHGWADKLRSKLFTAQCMLIGIGVEADLSSMAKSTVFRPSRPFSAGGLTFETVTLHNYSGENYAPGRMLHTHSPAPRQQLCMVESRARRRDLYR